MRIDKDVLEKIKELKPDIVFLDIQLRHSGLMMPVHSTLQIAL